jgi:hypothetical protein
LKYINAAPKPLLLELSAQLSQPGSPIETKGTPGETMIESPGLHLKG